MTDKTHIEMIENSPPKISYSFLSSCQSLLGVLLALWIFTDAAFAFDFPDSLRECQKSSSFSELKISDWSGKPLQVLHSERAGKACPSPDWNWLSVLDPRVVGYVQWIEVNFPPEGNGWAENLDPSRRDRWLFLDISQESRLKRSPFYSVVRGDSFFFDNPRSSSLQNVKWQARVYGITQDHSGFCKPIWGIQWGYSRQAGALFPVSHQVKSISRQQWVRDWSTVRGPTSNGNCIWSKK